MSDAKLEAYFFTAIFLTTLILVGMLFYPFLGSVALAMVLATLTTPFYVFVSKYIKNKNISALIVTMLVSLAIMLPAIGIFYLLVDEMRSISENMSVEKLRWIPSFALEFHARILEAFPFFNSINFSEIFQSFLQNIGAYTANVVTSTTSLLLKFFVALIAFYYFTLDGKKFLREAIKLSPLDNDEDHAIVQKLKLVTYSIVRGTLVVATMQGLLVGIGFLVFGVPNPVLWGSLAAVTALVPTLGTSLVSLPAIIYLFATGHVAAAVGLTAWAILIVGLVDNIISPRLIGQRSQLHPLFVLLSVLGGLSLFGISGFFLGPLVFGFLAALSEIYKIKIREIHNHSV
jgi:predicted PurR-regulated permease PerM